MPIRWIRTEGEEDETPQAESHGIGEIGSRDQEYRRDTMLRKEDGFNGQNV